MTDYNKINCTVTKYFTTLGKQRKLGYWDFWENLEILVLGNLGWMWVLGIGSLADISCWLMLTICKINVFLQLGCRHTHSHLRLHHFTQLQPASQTKKLGVYFQNISWTHPRLVLSQLRALFTHWRWFHRKTTLGVSVSPSQSEPVSLLLTNCAGGSSHYRLTTIMLVQAAAVTHTTLNTAAQL